MLALAAASFWAPEAHASVTALGSPRSLAWDGQQRAYEIPTEGSLSIEVSGPTALLLELRSKERGKRVIVDIYEGARYRSRNPIKLRPIGGGKRGYRFAALLALKAEKGQHRYDIRVQGAELVALLSARPKFYREFAARPFEDLEAPPPEEKLVATAPQPAVSPPEDTSSSPAADATAAPTDDSAAADAPGRDADIFGDGSVVAEAADDASADREAAMWGDTSEGAVSQDEAAVRLALTEDALSIGGRLFSQFVTTARRRSEPDELDLGNLNIVDAYFDARPTDRVRGYIRGRVFYSPSARDAFGREAAPARAALDQLWLKFDIGRTLFVTLGQQPLKWGTGRFWNPTDFVHPETRDPLAIVDDRVGVQMLKLHLPIESLGWNFVALANVTGAETPSEIEGAARAEFVLSTVELTVSTALRRDEPLRAGFDVSAGLFGIDFRLEWAAQRGSNTTFWEGDVSLEPSALRIPKDYQRRDEWLVQYVVGAEFSLPYSAQDSITVGAEYFSNDLGYEADPDLYSWLLLNGAFEPLHVGREYIGAYAAAAGPGPFNDTTITLSALANLSDGSWLTRCDWRVVAFTTLNIQAFAALHLGRRGELRYGFSVPAQPNVDGLERGLTVRAPLVDVGISALLNI